MYKYRYSFSSQLSGFCKLGSVYRTSGMDREGGSNGSCYYSVLGIRKDASFSEVRSAYRKLALQWHPDRFAKNPSVVGEAKRRFQKIQEAYSVLSDEGKRSIYDAGFIDLLEEDEGMGDFLHDLINMIRPANGLNMMDKNGGAEEESLEDLQRTFVEMFGGDLAQMMDNDPTVKKRSRDSGCGSSSKSAPRRRSNVNPNGSY